VKYRAKYLIDFVKLEVIGISDKRDMINNFEKSLSDSEKERAHIEIELLKKLVERDNQ